MIWQLSYKQLMILLVLYGCGTKQEENAPVEETVIDEETVKEEDTPAARSY